MSTIQYKVVQQIMAMQSHYEALETVFNNLGPAAQAYLDETLTEHNGMHANMPNLEHSLSSLPGSMEEVAKLDGDMRYKIFEAEQALMVSDSDVTINLEDHRNKCIEAIENKDWETVKGYLAVGFNPDMIAEHILIEGYEASPEIYEQLINEFPETLAESGHYNYLVDYQVEAQLDKLCHTKRPQKP